MPSLKELLPLSKKLSLLYVEDSRSTREIFLLMFRRVFKEIHVAENGAEGLELFKKVGADIVITDIEMPIMDGLSMAKEIKIIDEMTPVILVTAHIGDKFFLKSIDIGIDAYVPKPIDKDVIYKTIFRIAKTVHAHQRIKQESSYFKILTEASIVSKSNLDGVITYANENLCHITGYSEDELLGNSHNIFHHPDNPDSMYKEMWNTILGAKVWRGRVKYLRKDGTSFLADSIIIPLTDSSEHIKEFIEIRQDVTEYVMLQRRLQAEIRKKEERKKIDETKEAFLVLFTHELKTPLNAIINFTKYIYEKLQNSEKIDSKKEMNLLNSILVNSTEMLSHVNNILDVSKLRSGKLPYTKQLFSIKKVVDELVIQFDSLISQKGVDLEYDIDASIEIYSDEYRVKQLITNFISNAVKYGKGKILIRVTQSNHITEFSIDDNGNGIEDKSIIFDLYEQGDTALLKRNSKGTGIGLYLVKLLCDDLKIEYNVEDSKELGGTKFLLRFKNTRNK